MELKSFLDHFHLKSLEWKVRPVKHIFLFHERILNMTSICGEPLPPIGILWYRWLNLKKNFLEDLYNYY